MKLVVAFGAIGLFLGGVNVPTARGEAPYEVAVYYFPGYHPDPRNDARLGKGWTEWELIRAGVPRFEGQQQPKVPLWGYEDESDPKAMARKIGAAADHGVTAFIFDWYWHEIGPFLDRALDKGFLKAPNRGRLKFALMWANHDWIDIFPAKKDVAPKLLYPGAVSRQTFDRATDYVIAHYFSLPNYWKIDGKPYFSIYELWTLIDGLGGRDKAREALDSFRARVKAAGLPDVHLNAVGWGKLDSEMVTAMGIDSVTSYCWVHHVGLPEHTPYDRYARQSEEMWVTLRDKWKVPYYPNVSMGWDNTPRFAWGKTITGNTPAEFRKAMEKVKAFLDGQKTRTKVFTVNAWNEWTEGSYLEPDTVHRMAYLEAIRKVFPPQPPAKTVRVYPDGRPSPVYRMDAEDQGRVLCHGDGPNQCDVYGAREAIVYEHEGTYYLHYDGAGPTAWLACLATSKDLVHWTKKGPVLELGKPGEDDSATATSPWVYFDGKEWHMFYLGSPNATRPPDRIPSFPYLTRKAKAASPAGPWIKQRGVIPFQTKPGTYYSATASPGHVLKSGDEYLMFFSASTDKPCLRTLSIARTRDLDGPWTIDRAPIVPLAEQVENTSLYFEEANKTWFIFTNHIGLDDRGEYTDAVWVYWSKDLNKWNPADKAVVLDGKNCTWSTDCIGMPSVIKHGNRLAILYDAPGDKSVSHMKRDIGLAWLKLPLAPPDGR
jgi:hypothetical protein